MTPACPGRRRAALVATSAWLLLLAASASAHAPTASFDYAAEQPGPGELVEFRSTSVPVPEHTEPMVLDWDLDADGQFDDASGATARRTYAAGSHVVRLRARYLSAAGSHEDVAERTVTVGEPDADPTPDPEPTPDPPAPGANQAPVAAFDKDCSKTGGFLVCAGLFAREQKPHTIDATPSRDADGSIVRYEWDLDGTGGFERDTGATPTVTHTFERRSGLVDDRKRPVRVRVTDDKGATAEAAMTLHLLEPSCETLVTNGRLRATGLCMRPRNVEVDGEKVVRYHSTRPVTVNGIAIVPAGGRSVTIQLPAEAGAPAPRIASNGAAVSLPAVQGAAVDLLNGAFSWGMSDGVHLSGFKLGAGARLNGLRITGLAETPSLAADNTSSRFALHVALPADFGGVTSDEPVVISPGKAVASASEPLRFEVANATVGPVGLEQLLVTFDGEDLWEISARVKLPVPIPSTIKGDAGIRSNGDFDHAGAGIEFDPAVGPFGPIFLRRIAFRVEVNPKQSQCVPKVGIEKIDFDKLVYGPLGIQRPPDWPRYGEIDHGVPTFALCGEVGLTGGPSILGAAAIRMDAGLGVATYADRPTVFRAFGKLHVVELPLAKAAFELHTDGYVKARADFGFSIPDIVSLEGFLSFEMLKARFNAEAYVRACIDLVDLCAGARALISSKGIAACLRVDVLGATWEPGFGYEWGDILPTPYFAGCDVGDYREHIVRASSSRIRGRAAAAQHAIDLPAGLPGAVIAAEGRDAPPRITLVGPNGERVTTPDGMKAVQQKPFLLIKNLPGKVTQVAIGKPAAGRWRVIVEEGSSPIVSIRSAQGLPEPEVRARVTGRGHDRAIAYRLEQRDGQQVSFVERGPSAGTIIGAARGSAGRLRFSPADGEAERREIVAIVKQDGQVRDEITVARYEAPGPRRPGRPRALRVKRRGATLRLAWKAAHPADVHEVRVRISDGRRLIFRTRRHTLSVRGVRRGFGARVSVRGLLDTGIAGRPAIARAGRR